MMLFARLVLGGVRAHLRLSKSPEQILLGSGLFLQVLFVIVRTALENYLFGSRSPDLLQTVCSQTNAPSFVGIHFNFVDNL